MKRPRRWLLSAVFVLGMGLALPAVVVADPDSSAIVLFGNEDAGSPFAPPTGHDSSGNAKFNMIPRTAVISAGGSVTFEIDGFHQVAVYEAGTTPDDITVPAFPPNLLINDSSGRVALSPPPGTATSFTTAPGTFATPGRYLVLCNVTPHFAFFNMYGWVNVQ